MMRQSLPDESVLSSGMQSILVRPTADYQFIGAAINLAANKAQNRVPVAP